MSNTLPIPSTPDTDSLSPIRIWPVMILLLMGVASRYLPGLIEDGSVMLMMAAFLGPLICSGALLLWWILASRTGWSERLVGLAILSVVATATWFLMDESMRGPATMMFTIPTSMATFGIASILCSWMLSGWRTVLIIGLTIGCLAFSLALRTQGMGGDFAFDYHWRWTPTPEEIFLAKMDQRETVKLEELPTAAIDRGLKDPEWPGFRGEDRTSRQRGTEISTDWSTPPKLLWKIDLGPAWSSFAVAGNLLYTQEQRGPNEAVVCYDADTGREVWAKSIEARFDEKLGGVGPRATPTLAEGAVYAMGATGTVMRLEPRTGEILWKQDVQSISNREPPTWGFSSSPLVVGSLVIVYAGGAGDKGTLAFDTETGKLEWSASAGDHSYSSPQLGTVLGQDYVMMLTNTGLDLLDPKTGKHHLKYDWQYQGYRALQPQVIGDDTILVPTGIGEGTRKLRITKEGNQLSAEKVWTSRRLKPDFNDFVVYEGHAYGFGSMFVCIDLETGKQNWRGGNYGKGQVLLLEDSGLLLVAGEYGEVALLKANPSSHQELAKFQAIEGKTWNHPTVVGDRLYIRNAQQAACYKLPLASSETAKRN